jgi:hypothetical protein
MKRHDRSSPSSAADRLESTDPPLQGEGNYTAARRYRKSVKRFLDTGQAQAAAATAAPGNAAEERDMKAAENAGLSHGRH